MDSSGTSLNETQMNKMIRMGGKTACNYLGKLDKIVLDIKTDNALAD